MLSLFLLKFELIIIILFMWVLSFNFESQIACIHCMSLFITGSGVSRDALLRIRDQLFIKFFIFWDVIDLSSELSLLPPLALFSNIKQIVLLDFLNLMGILFGILACSFMVKSYMHVLFQCLLQLTTYQWH